MFWHYFCGVLSATMCHVAKGGRRLVRRGTLDFLAMAIAIRDMMQTYKICLCM